MTEGGRLRTKVRQTSRVLPKLVTVPPANTKGQTFPNCTENCLRCVALWPPCFGSRVYILDG